MKTQSAFLSTLCLIVVGAAEANASEESLQASVVIGYMKISYRSLAPDGGWALDPVNAGDGTARLEITGAQNSLGDSINLKIEDSFSGLPMSPRDAAHRGTNVRARVARDFETLLVDLVVNPGARGYAYSGFESQRTAPQTESGIRLISGALKIAPWTALQIEAPATISFKHVGPQNNSFAHAKAEIYGAVGAFDPERLVRNELAVAWNGRDAEERAYMLLSLENASSAEQPLFFGASAFADVNMSAVPEPANWLLALIGGTALLRSARKTLRVQAI